MLAAGVPQAELETGGARLHPDGNAVVEPSEVDQIRIREPRQVVLLASCWPHFARLSRSGQIAREFGRLVTLPLGWECRNAA
jgi:hypothetical protein